MPAEKLLAPGSFCASPSHCADHCFSSASVLRRAAAAAVRGISRQNSSPP